MIGRSNRSSASSHTARHSPSSFPAFPSCLARKVSRPGPGTGQGGRGGEIAVEVAR
jgi:hypothetical protein